MTKRPFAKNITTSPSQSVVRVNVTSQGYNFRRPWQQRTPITRVGIGVIIEGPHVLVTADALANHRYIEFEKVDNGEKSEAELEVVDYEANLALLRPIDSQYLENMMPVKLETGSVQGNDLAVWQVKPNGMVTPAMGAITSIELTRFPYRNFFLAYRLNSSLQYRLNHFTLPVIRNGKLAGLLMRYNAKEQTIDVISAPVIKHFLEDASDGTYQGFPLPDMHLVFAEDPQLRRYVGISRKTGGVYVDRVLSGSAAEKAGIQQGDIIMEVAGYALDSRGNYDHPTYGKISLLHLIRCEFHVGESIVYKIFRAGEEFTLQVNLDHRSSKDYIVPPYIIDTAPRYYILGGLVLQELSTSYLREYGKKWLANGPIYLLYYQVNQHTFEKEGRKKIVFLSSVLPTSYTIGYDRLANLVVTRINNKNIEKLEDVVEALKAPTDTYHKIEFEQRPKVIYIDPLELPKINTQIKKRYQLPALMNLNPS
ncbi:MAG: PDZ domain-containing protein [Desulfobacterales bacterium]|nr:MAG: PDZ domain-containing protein [Desulfobacterales bacterium]